MAKKTLIIFLFLNITLSYGQSDSTQNICPNLFVLGVIEIENPVFITYLKKMSKKQFRYENGRTGKWVYSPKSFRTYYNGFVTTKTNIPYVLENIKNIDNLIYDTNYYALHLFTWNRFIHTEVSPLCNEEETEMLNYMYEDKIVLPNKRIVVVDYYNKGRTVIAKNTYCRTVNTNKFLLILVNYDWYIKHDGMGRRPNYYVIPYFPVRKGVYIKVLIPIVGNAPSGTE